MTDGKLQARTGDRKEDRKMEREATTRIVGSIGNPREKADERRTKMIAHQIAHRDFGFVADLSASLANGGREPSLLLAAQEAMAAVARAQEDTAIEAQDALSQADEALVLG